MVKLTSQGLVAGLGLFLALSLATPAEAQKTRSSGSVSRSSSVVRSGRSVSSRGARARASSAARVSGRSTNRSVNKMGSSRSGGSLSRTRTSVGSTRARPQSSSNVIRYTRSAASRSGGLRTVRTSSSKLGGDRVARSSGKTSRVIRGTTRIGGGGSGDSGEFRNRGDLESARRGSGRRGSAHNRRHGGHNNGHGYRSGHAYHSGFYYGYRHGYSDGYRFHYHNLYHLRYSCHSIYFSHRCNYASLGFYYGGFGFYGPSWRFVLVLGAPQYYNGPGDYYYYNWNGGKRSRLYGWDETAYRTSDYRFDQTTAGACVGLRLTTVDDAVHEFRIDPTLYDAQDPGDLYALLWAEVEERGELEIEDLGGSLHIFPASQIRQIEATNCAY